MNEQEYAQFMTYLFERYVRPRLPRLRRRMFHHMEDEFHYHLDQAERSARVLRFIESYCDDDEDAYRTSRPSGFAELFLIPGPASVSATT
ncbi:MAG: hypothetical protein WCB68_22475 [Pyrinomonadaceae bacterium]